MSTFYFINFQLEGKNLVLPNSKRNNSFTNENNYYKKLSRQSSKKRNYFSYNNKLIYSYW